MTDTGDPTALSAPFWSATLRGELVAQRCRRCASVVHYPRHRCPVCWSDDLGWEMLSGLGTVFTYTVIRRPLHRAFVHDLPYVVAIVELDEGPHLTTNIVGTDPERVRIGMRVSAAYDGVAPGAALVRFRPLEEP